MWFIIPTVIISLILLALISIGAMGLYKKCVCAKCDSNKILYGKTAIVTGGTTGMGFELATDFARRGGRVIIACPFEDEGTNARDNIIAKTANEQVIFKLLNLGSLRSIREFADDILNTEERLNILINNAGVLTPDILTEDGMNFVMQVNYLGHFLLTVLLLPLLKKSGNPSEPSRIVNTSSSSHAMGRINIKDMSETGLKLKAYFNSKLCVTMFTRELARRLTDSVIVNTADPGMVATNIADNFGKPMVFLKILFGKVYPNAWEGAQTALYLALDEEAGKITGKYFTNCKLSGRGSAYDEELSLKLWDETVKLVNLSCNELDELKHL